MKKCVMCGKEVKIGLAVHLECVDHATLGIKSLVTIQVELLQEELNMIGSHNEIKYSEARGKIEAYEKVLEMIKDFKRCSL